MKTHRLSTYVWTLFLVCIVCAGADTVYAATLRVSPPTGVYSAGGTFSVSVLIDTSQKSVNAAEGVLSFNPRELLVVSASRGASIFNLWTLEPSYSNSAGTISFGGGSPNGYNGSAGTVMSVTFKALSAGNPKVTFTSGSVLAADGLGTNVLTSMAGGSYTINAPLENPEPEYIAPPNTPSAPLVRSTTHPDPNGWYPKTTAELTWTVPSDVTAIRTLLDETPGTIPTIVYNEQISSKSIEDLPQGISYFHIQFKNGEGWGKITHYRLGVDTESPSAFTIDEGENADPLDPHRSLIFHVTDISPIERYLIQIDGNEPLEFRDSDHTARFTLPSLLPGHHTIVAEAFDAAGNSRIATYSFDIASFERPIFTEYPSRINTEVIPVLRGMTRPRAEVSIGITGTGGEGKTYAVTSDDAGVFTFIPDGTFEIGVYDIVAVATDEFGAQSEPSDRIRMIVEEPGYLKIGSFVVSVLSIIVPLVALLLIFIFGLWYLYHKLRSWKRRITKETKEAEYRLAVEFDAITSHLADRVKKLKDSRKGKLTKAESELIDDMKKDIDRARERIYKEIQDIDDVVE